MNLLFLRPEWLWALLGLPLLVLWWRRRRQRDDVWRSTVDPHLLPHLLGGRARRGGPGLALLLIGWVLAVTALAGPSWRSGGQPLVQPAAPLVIALDLSGAALANDLPPSRLAQARSKIATLLRERAGGEVGLVVWADDAFTVAPLTTDAANLALYLDALAPGVMPVDGHRPDRAIRHAARLLEQAGFRQGDILLLTGEGSGAAERAAAAVAGDGYRVSVLGLGTPAGSAYREADGSFGRARLDVPALRAIASAGGGAYAGLRADSDDLRALGVLEPRSTSGDARDATTRLRLDEGYWLLLPLMLLAAFAFRRNALALVLALAWLPAGMPGPVHAQAATQATTTLEGGWWRRADQAAHARMQAGADAYREGDYATAIDAWRGLPGADAAYNLGNALARAGRYEQAVAAYDEALRREPGMDDARANREAVLQAMQRQPPPSGPQSDPDGESRGKDEPQPGEQQPPERQDEGQAGDDPGEAPATDAPPTAAPQAEDAQAQQAADEAQRRRMEQALRQAEDERGQDEPADAGISGTREEREQREANEAWLRRVPDDPGGLLREKFRLEHLRRQQGGGP